jgi:hypothetical protein
MIGNQPMAFIEVNGPQQYRSNGHLHRKETLKEHLYKNKYPNTFYIRIKYDQINLFGSNYVGIQVANFLLTAAPVRIRATYAGECNKSSSFFPLFSTPSQDSCQGIYVYIYIPVFNTDEVYYMFHSVSGASIQTKNFNE